MKNPKLFTVFALTLTLLTSACAAPPTAPPPTAPPPAATTVLPTATHTVAPPTATAVPPTATHTIAPPTTTRTNTLPVKTSAPKSESSPTTAQTSPPSPAPVTPSATALVTSPGENIAEIMLIASIKNQSIQSYRGEWTVQDSTGVPSTWKGEVRVPDVHFMYSEGAKQWELITVGNDYYLKNSTSPDAGEWFLLPESEHTTYGMTAPRPTIAQFSGAYGDPGKARTAILNSYHKTATVSLDGLSCDVYTMDKPAVASNFFNVWTQKRILIPPSDEFAAMFDQAETKTWLCADGYLHQIQVTLKPANAASGFPHLEVSAHIYDLNEEIQIVAPTSVQPFPAPTP